MLRRLCRHHQPVASVILGHLCSARLIGDHLTNSASFSTVKPIGDALKECRPSDASKWAAVLGTFQIATAKDCWLESSDADKNEIKEAGLPQAVINDLNTAVCQGLLPPAVKSGVIKAATGPENAMKIPLNSAEILEPTDLIWGILEFMHSRTTALDKGPSSIVDRARCVLVRGSPESGKSFTAQRILYYWTSLQNPATKKNCPPQLVGELERYKRAYYYCNSFGTGLPTDFVDDGETLLILDEAHGFFTNNEFATILKSGKSSLVMFSTTLTNLQGVTPVVLQKNQLWMFSPTAIEANIQAYIQHHLKNTFPDDICVAASKHLFPFCGNHVGMLQCYLEAVINAKRFLRLWEVESMPSNRLMRGSNGSQWSQEKQQFGAKLLVRGAGTVNFETCPKELAHAVKLGAFSPVRKSSSTDRSPCQKFDCVAESFTWSHPFQREFATTHYGVPMAPLPLPTATISTSLDVILAWIPQLPSDVFIAGLHSCFNDTLPVQFSPFSEAHLERNFVLCAPLVVRSQVAFHVAAKKGRPPALDLVVTNTTTGRLFAIELFVANITTLQSKWKEHYNRFEKPTAAAADTKNPTAAANEKTTRGEYYDFVEKHHPVWCVVGFVTEPMTISPEALPNDQDQHTILVSPHPSEGWNTFIVHHAGNKYEVLRHGAPSRLAENGTIQPLLPYTPPVPTNVWVRQRDPHGQQLVGSAFKVTPSTNDIDSLKKAIKVEIGPKYPCLIGPDIAILTPTKDGKWEGIVEPDTTLQLNTPGQPYAFQLPV